MVHRVIRFHLVYEPDLYPVTNLKRPGDRRVLGPRLSVYELPDHVGGIGRAVDLRHQVLPLEAVSMSAMVVCPTGVLAMIVTAMRMALVRLGCARRRGIRGHQLHATLRTRPRLRRRDLRVHGTDVGTGNRRLRLHRNELHAALRARPWRSGRDLGVHGAGVGGSRLGLSPVQKRHRGDDREHLVRCPLEVRLDRLALGGEFGIGAQLVECGGSVSDRGSRDRESAEVVDAIRGAVLEVHLSRRVEKHVDDRALRWREQHLLYEGLVLVAAGIAPDQLHTGAGEREVEDPSVRRVHQIEANYLPRSSLVREPTLAIYEHDVPESAHRGESRSRVPEGRYLSVLDEHVV